MGVIWTKTIVATGLIGHPNTNLFPSLSIEMKFHNNNNNLSLHQSSVIFTYFSVTVSNGPTSVTRWLDLKIYNK